MTSSTIEEAKEQRGKMRKEEMVTFDLLHYAVPAKHTGEGLRALSGESPVHPESVQMYLEGKFGDALEDVSNAIEGMHTSFLKVCLINFLSRYNISSWNKLDLPLWTSIPEMSRIPLEKAPKQTQDLVLKLP